MGIQTNKDMGLTSKHEGLTKKKEWIRQIWNSTNKNDNATKKHYDVFVDFKVMIAKLVNRDNELND